MKTTYKKQFRIGCNKHYVVYIKELLIGETCVKYSLHPQFVTYNGWSFTGKLKEVDLTFQSIKIYGENFTVKVTIKSFN